MPKKRDIKVFLLDIDCEIKRIERFTDRINSFKDFKNNDKRHVKIHLIEKIK